MKVIVDSNVFVSLYFEKEKFHEKSKEFHEKILLKEVEPVSSVLILPEICGGISRKTGKDKAREVRSEIESLVKREILKLEEINSRRMDLASDSAIEFQIRGADSIFISLSKEFNLPLFTFDEELKKKIRGKVKLFEI